MLEILKSCLALVLGLLLECWDILMLVAGWGCDVLTHLHTSAPRLEGLLVGVALAWLMMRRNKHPLLRVLSAPLKLVVDILDLAWDQVVEVASDLLGTARSWVTGAWSWSLGKVKGAYGSVMGALGSVRQKLSRKQD